MINLKRGMVVDINLNPTKGSETGKTRPCIIVTNDIYNERVPVIQVVPVTEWNEKKARILTNVEVEPDGVNGLTKKSIADCLQTRRGKLKSEDLEKIDQALKIVFNLT